MDHIHCYSILLPICLTEYCCRVDCADNTDNCFIVALTSVAKAMFPSYHNIQSRTRLIVETIFDHTTLISCSCRHTVSESFPVHINITTDTDPIVVFQSINPWYRMIHKGINKTNLDECSFLNDLHPVTFHPLTSWCFIVVIIVSFMFFIMLKLVVGHEIKQLNMVFGYNYI